MIKFLKDWWNMDVLRINGVWFRFRDLVALEFALALLFVFAAALWGFISLTIAFWG